MIKQLTPDILYIGTDDIFTPKFDNHYPIPEGMAYNSYLIKDEKVAILDTTDGHTIKTWKENLETALKGRTPDYLVVHHLEPDHSSLIQWVVEKYPSLQVVASAKCLAMIPQFFPEIKLEGRTIAVKDGDSLNLGKHNLQFMTAPMVHWPEVIVSFDEATGILFSADAFGKFGALGKCGFNSDEEQDWACEARRYYFNICGKYGGPVQTLLKKVAALPIKQICPLHGPMLQGDLSEYLRLYDIWSKYEVESEGVFVAYASIHGGTAAAAEKFADILRVKGAAKVVLTDLTDCDMAEAVEDAFRYGRLVIAASSYDGGVFPAAREFLLTLQDKAWQKRKVGIIENGSWAPSAARVMRGLLEGMREVEIVEPVVSIRSSMKVADLPAMEALADAILK